VFARVVEGIAVAQKISTVPADGQIPKERVEIRRVTIRDTPPPVPEPFVSASAAEMASKHVVLETSLGSITIELFPDRAPNHVRQFLRLAQSGVYDGTAFHRVVKGFVIQGGFMPTRKEPPDDRQAGYIRTLQPVFNDTTHDRGTLSMARGDDPASATSSFFIVLARTPALDGKYTAFGRVTAGLDVVEKIEAQPVNGETPVGRIEVTRARVE
jgi:peptidyl-prolyl cis-trans isomerase B (cyclophilin B)